MCSFETVNMNSAIVVHSTFDRHWPYAADTFRQLWSEEGSVTFRRLEPDDDRHLVEVLPNPKTVTRLVSLGVPVSETCVDRLTALEEAVVVVPGPGGSLLNQQTQDRPGSSYRYDSELLNLFEERGVNVYMHDNEGFWAQSVAECALGLTIAGLRRIPQKHARIREEQTPWNYDPGDTSGPGNRGIQFADDAEFTNGTVAGKRVRVVGVGNIGSRYANVVDHLGADVAAYDPYAAEPCFHGAGARRIHHLAELPKDAEIFAPMVPLTDGTRGLITRDHVDSLPEGSLVVLTTRANVCDMEALRERVLADELSLAADVWDVEPLLLDDPLLGRHNVVHTPHLAGRTRHANEQWAERLAAKFRPIDRSG